MYFVKDQYVVGISDGTKKYVAEIFADTSNDLPAYNNCKSINGELTLGTIALVADEAEFYTMTSEGIWHKRGEEEDDNSRSVNSGTKSMSSDTKILTKQDFEQDSDIKLEPEEEKKELEPEEKEPVEEPIEESDAEMR